MCVLCVSVGLCVCCAHICVCVCVHVLVPWPVMIDYRFYFKVAIKVAWSAGDDEQ